VRLRYGQLAGLLGTSLFQQVGQGGLRLDRTGTFVGVVPKKPPITRTSGTATMIATTIHTGSVPDASVTVPTRTCSRWSSSRD